MDIKLMEEMIDVASTAIRIAEENINGLMEIIEADKKRIELLKAAGFIDNSSMISNSILRDKPIDEMLPIEFNVYVSENVIEPIAVCPNEFMIFEIDNRYWILEFDDNIPCDFYELQLFAKITFHDDVIPSPAGILDDIFAESEFCGQIYESEDYDTYGWFRRMNRIEE